ncbi:MAG: hypothetical protein FDX12_02185 [Chlorobium sp.]|jgi:hypothetical protein|nr:MAG: hypothetical protein FDX12_02185 [Chlorobium sp.]
MSDKPKYWFPAKCYGWGWGPPSTWQGWIVLAGYLLLMIPGIIIIDPKVNMINFLLYTTALTVIFIIICWCKGEPPRWRWGKGEDN